MIPTFHIVQEKWPSYIDHEAENGQTVGFVRCLAKACVFLGIPVNQVKLRKEKNLHV